MYDCGCSEDYGPCENHADILVIRQGAALHTADELSLLLVSDLIDCGVKLREDEEIELRRLEKLLEDGRDETSGCAWFLDHDDSEASAQLATEVEQSAEGLWVTRDDGYVISRPHDDCPLLEG